MAFGAHCRWIDIVPGGAQFERELFQRKSLLTPRISFYRLDGSNVQRLVPQKGNSLHTIGGCRSVALKGLKKGRVEQGGIKRGAVKVPVPVRLYTDVVIFGAQDRLKGPDSIVVPR